MIIKSLVNKGGLVQEGEEYFAESQLINPENAIVFQHITKDNIVKIPRIVLLKGEFKVKENAMVFDKRLRNGKR